MKSPNKKKKAHHTTRLTLWPRDTARLHLGCCSFRILKSQCTSIIPTQSHWSEYFREFRLRGTSDRNSWQAISFSSSFNFGAEFTVSRERMGGVVASAVARRDSAAPAAASGLASLSAENMHRASSFVVNTKRFDGFLPRSSDTEMTKSQLTKQG